MTIHEFIEENRAAMVSDIIDLVNIPTVYSEDADSGQPFGKEVDRGLKDFGQDGSHGNGDQRF